jgi:hypothetical protein
MSTFERDEYKWRETYFVLFDSSKRPLLKSVEKTLHALSERFQLTNATADEDGRFESITVMSPDDYAALDISYEAGEEVLEQVETIEAEFKQGPLDSEEKKKLARLKTFDAKFDLLHFEQTADDQPEDDQDEMLDPSALLIVLDAVVELTGGVGVDPQSGTLL